MSPWFSSRLCPSAPSAGVTEGQLAPSTGANNGSVPPVLANTARAASALSPNAFAWKWQLAQLRPLVPKLRKNALPRSMLPVVLTVPICPVRLGDRSGSALLLAARSGCSVLGAKGARSGSHASRSAAAASVARDTAWVIIGSPNVQPRDPPVAGASHCSAGPLRGAKRRSLLTPHARQEQ